jgi:hypothetical protein
LLVWLESFSGGLKIVQRLGLKEMMQRLNIVAGFVTLILILGGGLVLSSCASTNYTYTAPAPADIPDLIMEWDRLERTIGQVKPEFREQYAKALKALSNAIAEQERWRARAENK